MAKQKNATPSNGSELNSEIAQGDYISLPEAKKFIDNFLKQKSSSSKAGGKKKSSPCFIGLYDLYEFMRVPNFQGINIHNGLNEKGEEVFIFTPITKIDKKLVEVRSYTVSYNDETEPRTYSAYMVRKRPCPPPPPGYSECPQSIF